MNKRIISLILILVLLICTSIIPILDKPVYAASQQPQGSLSLENEILLVAVIGLVIFGTGYYFLYKALSSAEPKQQIITQADQELYKDDVVEHQVMLWKK